MRIQTNTYNINAKAIHLNKQETINAQNILAKYSCSSSLKREQLTLELLSIFEEKIRTEGVRIAKTSHNKHDCIHDLFLNFLESIIESVNVKEPLNFILERLNSFKKKKSSRETEFGRASIDRKITTGEGKALFFTDIIEKDINSKRDTDGQEQARNELDKLSEVEFLTEKEKIVLDELSRGKTHKQIAEKMGIALTNVNKHIAKAIKKIQSENECLSQEIKDDIVSLKQILGLENDDKNVEKLLIQLSGKQSINKIVERVVEYKDLLKTTDENVIYIFSNFPTLLSLKMSTVKNNIKQSSELLGLSENDFIELCKKHPSLLYGAPQRLQKNAKNLQEKIGFSDAQLLKVIKFNPSLLANKYETLDENIEGLANLLAISKKDCIKLYQKTPYLFLRNYRVLESNMRRTAELLNIDFDKYILLAQKQVNLIYQKPETIYNNLSQGAKLLNVDVETLRDKYMKKPQLFIQKPETIYNNVLKLAELLHLDLSSCIKLCFGNPQLLYMNPENIYNKAKELAQMKQVDIKSIVEWAIKQPVILLYSSSLVKQKMEINNFYSKVINEPLKGTTIGMYKDEDLYIKILKFLIKKANKTLVSSSRNVMEAVKQNLIEHPEVDYVFELPLHAQTENFINFSENFSKEVLGKNIFTFKIKEN